MKVEAYIHSLKDKGHDRHVLGEAEIIRRFDDNFYLAEVNGVRCTAVFNPFVGRYFIDDVYGLHLEIPPCVGRRMRIWLRSKGARSKDSMSGQRRSSKIPFIDNSHYGIILGKNSKDQYVTWEFHLLDDESVSVYSKQESSVDYLGPHAAERNALVPDPPKHHYLPLLLGHGQARFWQDDKLSSICLAQ